MGLPTKIGRSFMKRLILHPMVLAGILALTLGACVHKPSKITKAAVPIDIPSAPPQEIVLLQEARTESQNMRAELASLKILLAKQEGELRALRSQSQAIHEREEEQGHQLQKIRSELISTQLERDQLQKYKTEMEGQIGSASDTAQLLSDIQAIRTSFQQMMTNMQGLVADMHSLKQEIRLASKNKRSTTYETAKDLPL